MDIRKVKKLIELLEESGIAEIEISEGEESVRISRYPPGTGAAAPVMHYAAPPAAATPIRRRGPSGLDRTLRRGRAAAGQQVAGPERGLLAP